MTSRLAVIMTRRRDGPRDAASVMNPKCLETSANVRLEYNLRGGLEPQKILGGKPSWRACPICVCASFNAIVLPQAIG